MTYAQPNSKQPITATGANANENRRNILHKTLNIFKGGFYSHNEEVVMACGMLFIRIMDEINNIGGDLIGDSWEWFTTTTQKPEFKRETKNDKMQR